MHRTPSKVVILNLSESFKKYANLCKLVKIIMLIYIKNSLLIYIFYGLGLEGRAGYSRRGLKGRAGCRQTEVQTDRQTDDLCLLRQRIAEQTNRRSLEAKPTNWRIIVSDVLTLTLSWMLYVWQVEQLLI